MTKARLAASTLPTHSEPSKFPDGRGGIVLPAGIAVLFLAVTLVQAHFKLLWGDEFVTYWIGQQGSFHGIWRALAAGADPNPPLMHLLDWWSTRTFGSGAIAIRLPSILGMALALGSVWALLRRYLAPVYAAAGCLALMATRGFDYAYDARSYSLLLVSALAALAAWVSANGSVGWRRSFWLIAMALALACGVSVNYYGVMAFFPIAVGEAVVGRGTKRLRAGVWLGLIAATLPLLGFLGLIQRNIAEFGPHAWNKPHLSMIVESYGVLVEGIVWPVAFLAGVWMWKRRRGGALSRPVLPKEVRAAVAVLVAYPLLGFAIALGGAGMISARCVIPVCAGIALAGAALLGQLARPRVAAGVVVVMVAWVLAREAACGYVLLHQRHAFLRLRDSVERAAAPGEAVVVGDSLVVMPLYWYGSDALRRQIVFPVDFEAIHRSETDDSGEQNLWGGRNGVFPVRIGTPSALIQQREERVLVGPPHGWLAQDLRARGYALPERPVDVPWDRLGGVFTPLAHERTRILLASPAQAGQPSGGMMEQ